MSHAVKTKSEKATLAARRTVSYVVLVLLSFLCLFFFYVLLINSTRTHFEIQKGFSLLPGKSLLTNLKNVLSDANIPVLSGVRNSLLVSACSAALSVYFSALTAYGIYAYNFKFKKAAFALILLIMTMPTQVSALGFLQLITKMGLKNSFLPSHRRRGRVLHLQSHRAPHHEARSGSAGHLLLCCKLEQLLHPRTGVGYGG